MDNKKLGLNWYVICGAWLLILHIIATFYLFLTDEINIVMSIISILITPPVFILYYGIGRIVTHIDKLDVKAVKSECLQEIEEKQDDDTTTPETEAKEQSLEETKEEVKEDAKEEESKEIEVENENKKVDISDEVTTDEEKPEEVEESTPDKTTEEESQKEEIKPIISNGKVKCIHCGKFNKLNRENCTICGKKLIKE